MAETHANGSSSSSDHVAPPTRPPGVGGFLIPGEARMRSCCARCFTPWMCANPGCGCHHDTGDTCKACGADLYRAPTLREIANTLPASSHYS